jgi:hypothetical protein
MAFTEDSVSVGMNQRWLGMPRGVYHGFLPVVVSADVVELQTDPELSVSLLKVGSSQARGMIDIFTQDAVQLNFTGHTEFPVYIIARSDYQVSAGTNARIFTRATPASGHNEVQIGMVDQVGGNLVVSAVAPLEYQTPVAITDQSYGYMSEGSVEDIQAANSATAEVVASRVDLTTATQASLSDRIEADMNGTAMADRLSLRVVHLESNVYDIGVGDVPAGSINVSGSFSSVSRAAPPFLDLGSDGSETVEGVVCAPTNTTDNICPVVDADSGERIETISGNLLYSRLESDFSPLTGSAAFIVASPFVVGTGTLFTTELEPGDLFLGPDGRYYEVLEITSDLNLELASAFQGISTAFPSLERRRFTLRFYTTTGGSEQLENVDAAQSIQFFFGAWLRTDVTSTNAFAVFKARAERPTVPDATKTVFGKALQRAEGGLAGAVRRVRDNGITVADNPHTLNFVVPGSVTDLGNGECAVSVVGDTGPTGAPGPVGPTGPQGEPGNGLETHNYLVMSGPSGTTINALAASPGGNTDGRVLLVHVVDFTSAPTPMTRVDHLTGGLGYFKNIRSYEIVRINHIAITDYATTRVTGEIEGEIIPNNPFPTGPTSNTEIKLFLGAFGA